MINKEREKAKYILRKKLNEYCKARHQADMSCRNCPLLNEGVCTSDYHWTIKVSKDLANEIKELGVDLDEQFIND